jgi:hypothetical protein
MGLTRGVIEDTIVSPLFLYFRKIWLFQLESLRKELESTSTYEELKFKLGKIANLRHNLQQLKSMEEVIYPNKGDDSDGR